jgi:hypothetical protein
VNTQLRVLAQEGDWLRVEFTDPQFGRRVGYIAAKKVRLSPAQVQPKDPLVREPAPPSRPPQSTKATQAPRRPAQSSGLGVRGYGSYGSTAFDATETLNAVAGSSRFANVGGGVTVTNLWRGLFVDIGVSQSKVDGQRVFVDGDTVYELAIPLNIAVRPIDVAAGWRVTAGRLSTFVGGGLTSFSYEEKSGFAEPADDLKVRRSGPLVLAGIDVTVVRWVQVGGEVRYRAVKGILGEGGASHAFGEDQAGGTSAGIRVSIGK